MRNLTYVKFAGTLIACSLTALSCGKKSDTAAADTLTTTTTAEANALAVAYPGSLALSVFPSTVTKLLGDDAAAATRIRSLMPINDCAAKEIVLWLVRSLSARQRIQR